MFSLKEETLHKERKRREVKNKFIIFRMQISLGQNLAIREPTYF